MGKAKGSESGFSKACEHYKKLMKTNPTICRQDLIKEFVKIGLSAGASYTYASTVKKAVGGGNPNAKVKEIQILDGKKVISRTKIIHKPIVLPEVKRGGKKFVLGAPVRFEHQEGYTTVKIVTLVGKIAKVHDEMETFQVIADNYPSWGKGMMGPYTKAELKLL